jgi:uncharacterized protein (DUF2132 family)
MPTPTHHSRDPLHGITLERILRELVDKYGWLEMGERIRIRCFQSDPSIKSSLTFLRKTPWARSKVERWYVDDHWKALREGLDPGSGRPGPDQADDGGGRNAGR